MFADNLPGTTARGAKCDIYDFCVVPLKQDKRYCEINFAWPTMNVQ